MSARMALGVALVVATVLSPALCFGWGYVAYVGMVTIPLAAGCAGVWLIIGELQTKGRHDR